ncbi:hypothetical protein CIL02_13415 [Prevotella sp. P3-122]|nr:hypothetical protein CIL02_13415 [Prevotella sp. P3-122]
MGLLNESNALRRQMQSFAWTDAMLCVGKCKALRGQMQSFARADAKLCGNGCKALRLRWAKLARKFSVLFWIRVNGGKTHLTATVVPRKFLPISLNVGLSKKCGAFIGQRLHKPTLQSHFGAYRELTFSCPHLITLPQQASCWREAGISILKKQRSDY